MQPITIAITNFNGEEVILRTIDSAKRMTHREMSLLVVDDGSTDSSVSLVARHHPEVRIVSMGHNTAQLNRVRNTAIRSSDTRLVFLVDNDVTFDPNCLSTLLEAHEKLPQAAICTPIILTADTERIVYGGGHDLNFLCVSTDSQRGKPLGLVTKRPRPAVGGGIQLIDKEALSTIGFFSERLALGWGDDGELHFRVNLCGLWCYTVPEAIVYHPHRSRQPRIYGQILNRWLILLQSYSLRSLCLLMPALIVYELILLAFLIRKGQLAEYGRAMRSVVTSRQRWLAERRRIQALRKRSERELLTGGPLYVPGILLRRTWERMAVSLISRFFGAYWRMVRWLI